MRRIFALLLVVALIALLCGCQADTGEKSVYYRHADYPIYDTFNELFSQATHVIYGRITDISQEMLSYSISHSELDKEPTTVYTVEILQHYKGEISSNIFYIRQFGGETDTAVYIYPDEPQLVLGDNYILFLGGNCIDENTAWLLNAHQSVYLVSENKEIIDVGGKGFPFSFSALPKPEDAGIE